MDTNGHTILSEDYVSFEVAKLLKEKGFDECIFEFYEGYKIKYARNGKGFRLSELGSDMYYPHITHQMAMKWLREVHNISVEPFSDWVFSDVGWICLWSVDIAKIVRDGLITELTRKSYEEAVEAALKYVLENLI